jgi:hypothetical protein
MSYDEIIQNLEDTVQILRAAVETKRKLDVLVQEKQKLERELENPETVGQRTELYIRSLRDKYRL